MKFAEIANELVNLCNKYYEEAKNLTNAQKYNFQKQFARKYRIDCVSGDPIVEIIKLKLKIDDTVQIRDVCCERLEVSFMKYKQVYRIILTNGFSFLTKSRAALDLNKGQSINVQGVVNASISGESRPQIRIYPADNFSVKYM